MSFGESPSERFQWDDSAKKTLVRLWAEGRSATEIRIAVRFDGLMPSRNSVLGHVHRMGLAKRICTDSPRRRRGDKPTDISAVKIRTRNVNPLGRKHKQKDKVPSPPTEIIELPPEDAAVQFCDLLDGQCKWMPGEPSHDALCCGAPSVPGRSYCGFHLRRAYEKPRTKSQQEVVNARAAKMRAAKQKLTITATRGIET